MMLARNAESLYWIGRYVERADDMARLLDVAIHQLLEDTSADVDGAVRMVIQVLGLEVPDTDDPLLRALLDSGRARIHTVDGVETHSMEATGAEIAEDAEGGHNLVSADGEVDPAIVVLGIPAQSTQPGSAIGAAPGVPSPLLAGADVAARQVMARARVSARL